MPSPANIRTNTRERIHPPAGSRGRLDRFPLPAGPTTNATLLAAAGPTGSPLVVTAAGLTVRPATPSSGRLNAATVHINVAAAGASRPLPAPSHEDRSNTSPLPTAVITGVVAFAAATDGVDGTRKSVADDPVSAGVEDEGEGEVDNDDPASEPLPEESVPATEVSTERRCRAPGPLPATPAAEPAAPADEPSPEPLPEEPVPATEVSTERRAEHPAPARHTRRRTRRPSRRTIPEPLPEESVPATEVSTERRCREPGALPATPAAEPAAPADEPSPEPLPDESAPATEVSTER